MPNDPQSHSRGRGCCLYGVSCRLLSREYVFGLGFIVGCYNAGPCDRRKIRLKALCRRGIEHVTSRA